MSSSLLPPFNPLAPEVLSNPYPHYANLRHTDPVHWGSAADADLPGRWYITRFDDVNAVLKDQRFGREVHKVLPLNAQAPVMKAEQGLSQLAEGWMILRDPPVHTRLRSLVHTFYTPRKVNEFRAEIEAIAHHLLDEMLIAGPPLDLLTHFSLPLTVLMTAHLLGLPRADYDRLMPWSRALAAVIDLNQAEEVRERSRQAVAELTDYLSALLAARRRQPQADLISALVQQEEQVHPVNSAELLGSLTHLLFVGNDPVMHEIGMAVITLMQHPDQLALLRANPGLMPNALDELMRYDSPVQMTFRYALTDVELHGKQLRTGDHVALVLGSANRDSACCPAPDLLAITRPVGQVAHFGAGIHYCLGAPLAKLEGQIALNALLQRLPDLALATNALDWQKTVAVRGVVELPVVF